MSYSYPDSDSFKEVCSLASRSSNVPFFGTSHTTSFVPGSRSSNVPYFGTSQSTSFVPGSRDETNKTPKRMTYYKRIPDELIDYFHSWYKLLFKSVKFVPRVSYEELFCHIDWKWSVNVELFDDETKAYFENEGDNKDSKSVDKCRQVIGFVNKNYELSECKKAIHQTETNVDFPHGVKLMEDYYNSEKPILMDGIKEFLETPLKTFVQCVNCFD